jgi:hypothetical protein
MLFTHAPLLPAHGKTDRRIAPKGQIDVALNATGLAQAEAARNLIETPTSRSFA